MFDRAKQLSSELQRWCRAGFPVRPAGVVRQTFNAHCKPCEFYQGGNAGGICTICKCSVRRERASLNKLSMATTSCPLPEPKWVEYENATEFDEPSTIAQKARKCC